MSFRQSIAKLCKRLRNSAPFSTKPCSSSLNAGMPKVSCIREFEDYSWTRRQRETFQWIFLSGQAAIFLGMYSTPSFAEDVSIESSSKNGTTSSDIIGLQKVDDGSIISNEHTSKWRIFTDNGRDYFMRGNIEQAEKFFVSALQEAKEGFGKKDPHVASACNNLAELYRVRKAFDDAEPLYLEAINILEEYYGTDDIRVGAALHNVGQFYLVQRKIEKARACYERALKIKRRVLGEAHPDYADTLYHLGTILLLQGNEKDSADLIQDSIRILEGIGQGESSLCVRRKQYLAQIYTKSNRFDDAEILLRKVLHMMELSKGWKSLDTLLAAERLALAIEKVGKLIEAEELLQRCLDTRKNLLPTGHIQNATNMLYLARVKILITNQLMERNSSQAVAELDAAKNHLQCSVRIARQVLVHSVKQKNSRSIDSLRKTAKEGHAAALILLQSLNSLALLETMKLESPNSKEKFNPVEAPAALGQCISTFKEFGSEKWLSDSPEIKTEYLLCLRRLHDLLSKGMTSETRNLDDVQSEILQIEAELSNTKES